MLLSHELDMAFTINTATEGDGIESRPIVSYHICAVMSKTHPLAKRDDLSVKDLLTQNIQCYAHQLKAVCQKQSCKVFMDILTKESIPYLQSLEG